MTNRTRLLLLLAVCTAGAYGAYSYWAGEDHRHAAAQVVDTALRDGVPGPDEAAVPVTVVATPPASSWLEKRTARYAGLFKDFRCDVLIVPMQVEGGGFDRPNREIMTADLALALGSTGQCVTDPFLLDPALGEALRRRDPDAVLALARTIKASRILTVYAGHYQPGKMRVTLQVSRLDPAKPGAAPVTVAAHSFENLEYGDESPPFVVFHTRLPEMLSAVGIDTGAKPAPTASGAMPEHLPASVEGFLGRPDGPAMPTDSLGQSAELTFLGMLAPNLEWRATERLFTKAWVALEPADAKDPAVRRLRARILFHLQERPLALAQIKDDTGAEAEGLRAVLNGNLPQARQALAQVQGEWDRFCLGLEVHDLELEYERDPRSSEGRVMQLFTQSALAPFVERRLHDLDRWSLSSTGDFKTLLDQHLPIPGFQMSDIPIGGTLMALFDRPELELEPLRQVHRLVEQQPQRWCCKSFSAAPAASDLLDLLDSRIEHTVGRQAYYYIDPQGRYDRALEVLNSYDAELAGSPCAEQTRAIIYSALMYQVRRDKREDLNQKMHQAARLSAWWDQSQSPDINSMLSYMYQEPKDPALDYLVKFTDDYPIRQYWQANLHVPTAEARLAFSSENSDALADLIKTSKPEERARYLAVLDTRFIGGPYATSLRLDNMSDAQKSPQSLRAEIARDPDNWKLYNALGRVQIRKDAYSDVVQTVLSYPPFGESDPNDPVALSNHVSAWGHSLFWLGAFEQARPLLQKGVDYHTGSGESGYSAAHLAQLDQKYAEAAGWFAEVAHRYNAMPAYREFISMMFAAGLDDQAWKAFDQVTGHYEVNDVWTAAMVAHRRAGVGDVELAKWYADRMVRLQDEEDREHLRLFAFLSQVVDRMPSAEFAGFMQALAPTAGAVVHPNGSVYPGSPASGQSGAIGPSGFGKVRRQKLAPGTAVPDRYALAAQAMQAVQSGRYEESVSAFDRLSSFYQIEKGSMNFVVPYFAYAAAKTGDTLGYSQFLDGLPENEQSYPIKLGRAVFAAMSGRHADALNLLEGAFHDWAYNDPFPLTAYEYLNTCTLLFEATGDDRYRQAALRLARPLRHIEPTQAYGHALVAYLGDNDKERTDALSVALYLDPRSVWAAKAPAALRARVQGRGAPADSPFMRGSNAADWSEIESSLVVDRY